MHLGLVRNLHEPIFDCGTIAYRCILDRQHLESIPDDGVQALVAEGGGVCRLWLGPKAHAVFYAVKGGNVFNLVVMIAQEAFHDSTTYFNRDEESCHVSEFLIGWDHT